MGRVEKNDSVKLFIAFCLKMNILNPIKLIIDNMNCVIKKLVLKNKTKTKTKQTNKKSKTKQKRNKKHIQTRSQILINPI